MKKALLSATLVFVFCLTMLLGTTYAWFNETIEIKNNAIKTGNLDITFAIADPQEDPNMWYNLDVAGSKIFDNDYLYPGAKDSRSLKITNTGNIDVAVRLVSFNGNATDQALKDAITFTFKFGNFTATTKYKDLATDYLLLVPGETVTFELSYEISTALGNEGQNDYLTFDVKLEAIQLGEVKARNGRLYNKLGQIQDINSLIQYK